MNKLHHMMSKKAKGERDSSRLTTYELRDVLDIIAPLLQHGGLGNATMHYGATAPCLKKAVDGDLWFDSENLRLNVFSGGAWINPDRKGSDQSVKDRMAVLEHRLNQLEKLKYFV